LDALFSDITTTSLLPQRHGAVLHLMQLSKSSNAALQQEAVTALRGLVNTHHDNQSAAAAAGAQYLI